MLGIILTGRCRALSSESTAAASRVQASLWELFLAFAKLGSTSFGGGLTGWMMRDIVGRRRWMTEEEFLTGLAMAQALPGVNVVNLPLWIGYRMDGLPGALAAAAGVIFPPAGILAMMAVGYSFLSRYPQTKLAFAGAAAAAIGLSGAMGLRAAQRQVRKLVPAVILALTFVAVGVLRLPMLAVLAVLAPISIGFAYHEAKH